MIDGPNLRWIWITSDGQWGELQDLWVVDADDPMISFLEQLKAEGTPQGVANIGEKMGLPLSAIVPPLPKSSSSGN